MSRIGTNIQEAAQLLRAGELVAIPTETVYGLAGHALMEDAVLKIFAVKNRPHFNPLIAHTDNWQKARQWVTQVPPLADQLARHFWPGPLTLLLPRAAHIPDLLTAGSPLVAIRVPAHALTLSLLAALDFPLAAPSANPSGYISPTSPAHVEAQLGGKIAYILDGGPTQVGIESTIIGFDEEGRGVLHRLGGLSLEALEAVSGPLTKRIPVQENPETPGQLKSHYAPSTPLVWKDEARKHELAGKLGALRFREPQADLPLSRQIVLSPAGGFGGGRQRPVCSDAGAG